MNDDEITVKENEDRRRIMREQSDQISRQGAEIERLREALLKYGKHGFHCSLSIDRLPKFARKPCNCGWDKLQATLREEEK